MKMQKNDIGCWCSWKCWNNMSRRFQVWCNINFLFQKFKVILFYQPEVYTLYCIVGFLFYVWYAEKLTKVSNVFHISIFFVMLRDKTLLCLYRFYTRLIFVAVVFQCSVNLWPANEIGARMGWVACKQVGSSPPWDGTFHSAKV